VRQAFDPGEAAGVSIYPAVVKQDGDWWLGWVEEVPGVNAQEPTREALLASLKEVLREALEMNRTQPELNRRSAIPRHTDIKKLLVRKICSDLGTPRP
jgi:predicted RNase H-like HicB family nuclease